MRETERQRDRDMGGRERQRDRETETETERETYRERDSAAYVGMPRTHAAHTCRTHIYRAHMPHTHMPCTHMPHTHATHLSPHTCLHMPVRFPPMAMHLDRGALGRAHNALAAGISTTPSSSTSSSSSLSRSPGRVTWVALLVLLDELEPNIYVRLPRSRLCRVAYPCNLVQFGALAIPIRLYAR